MSFDERNYNKEYKDLMKYFQGSSSSSTSPTVDMQLFTTIEERREASRDRSWIKQKYTYGDYPRPEDVIKISQEIKGINIDSIIIDDLSFVEESIEEPKEKELQLFDPKDLDI